MSLAIDVDHVTAVLLTDGWHTVADDSFNIDSYEFLWWGQGRKDRHDPVVLHGGGQSGVCAAGYGFRTPEGDYLAGPLTAILGVRYDDENCDRPRCTEPLGAGGVA